MAKGGYDKLLRKYQRLQLDNADLRREVERLQKVPAPDQETLQEGQTARSEKRNKLREFWTSSPLWGAVGMLGSLLISPVSVKIVYAVCWAIICFEFVRIKVFGGKPRKVGFTVSTAFAISLGVGIISAWPYLPKPERQPSLDSELAKFGDSIVQRVSAVVGSKPSPSSNAEPPKPSFARIEQYGIGSGYFNAVNPADHAWLLSGKPVLMNVAFSNSGTAPADHFLGFGKIYIQPANPDEGVSSARKSRTADMQAMRSDFDVESKKGLALGKPGTLLMNGSGDRAGVFFTARSTQAISDDDIARLASGQELLYLLYEVQWTDPSGSHHMRKCQMAQTPAFNPEIWGGCYGFDEFR